MPPDPIWKIPDPRLQNRANHLEVLRLKLSRSIIDAFPPSLLFPVDLTSLGFTITEPMVFGASSLVAVAYRHSGLGTFFVRALIFTPMEPLGPKRVRSRIVEELEDFAEQIRREEVDPVPELDLIPGLDCALNDDGGEP
jgi:hypothetical protein